MNTATVFDIQRSSFVDGPGIRTTVFFKGCNLKCRWCHNPESQEKAPQMLFYRDQCVGCGKCAEVCPNHLKTCDLCGKCVVLCPKNARQICGKTYTTDELLDEIVKDELFYQTSGGGVTFSGGECMLQIDALAEILKKCKRRGIPTAVDTAGAVAWEGFQAILPYTDLFLYDIKCFSEPLHMRETGVSNRLILENLQKLSDNFVGDIIVRIPVMPGFNDDAQEMQSIADFLKHIHCKKIELLPYHKMGEHKYAALGRPFGEYQVPDRGWMQRCENIIRGAE